MHWGFCKTSFSSSTINSKQVLKGFPDRWEGLGFQVELGNRVGGTLWLQDLRLRDSNMSYFYQEGEGDAELMLACGIAPFLPALCRELQGYQQSDNRSLQPVKPAC